MRCATILFRYDRNSVVTNIGGTLEVALDNHPPVWVPGVAATCVRSEQSPQAKRPQRIAVALVLCMLSPLGAEQRSNPASMQSFQIPSHGALLNAFVYVAAGAGPHPAVVLLHGFPGNERNLDLAQDIRRAGWDVLYFDYRGSWGSAGDFSFTHGIEDTAAAVDYLRSARHGEDPAPGPIAHRAYRTQHGRLHGSQAAAADPAIIGVGLISAADIGGRIPQPLPKDREPAAIKALSAAYDREGMAPLSGCTAEGLAHEMLGQCIAMELHG